MGIKGHAHCTSYARHLEGSKPYMLHVDTHARGKPLELLEALRRAVADITDTPHVRVGGYLPLCLIVCYPLLIRACFFSMEFLDRASN